MNKMKRWLLAIACILLPLALAIVATAQEVTTDVPDFVNDLPFIGAFAAGLGLFLCCIIFLVPLIIAILACIWIYKDAERRGKQGILWVLLLLVATILFNIVGFIVVIIIWLAVRPKETK